MPAAVPDDDLDGRLDATERWFLRRGVPHLIAEYRATEDVFTRMLPFLVVVFVAELSAAARATWPWWLILVGFVGGVAAAVGGWAVLNVLRGRRAWNRPDRVGAIELGFFVVVPGLVRFAVTGRAGLAVLLVLGNAVLLSIVYLVTSYGIVPLLGWASGFTVRQIGSVIGLFGRSMPLLLLFTVGLFINTEMWQVAATLDGWLFWATGTFFVAVGVLFLLLRLPPELARIIDEVDAEDPVERCAGSPVAALADAIDPGEQVPLSGRQRGNLLLVLFFSQAVQVLLVSVAIAVFFLLFGVVAIRPETIGAWLGDAVDPGHLVTWHVGGQEIVVTRALVHVAGFLGFLSGFYFTVYVITDGTYREQFFTEIAEEVRESLAVRRVYLALRARLHPEG
jgi:hypothetical protein